MMKYPRLRTSDNVISLRLQRLSLFFVSDFLNRMSSQARL